MLLRGAGRTADAIAPRSPAEQHDHVARCGTLAHDLCGGRRTDDGTNLHALGEIAPMIDLVHLPRRKSNLVAV